MVQSSIVIPSTMSASSSSRKRSIDSSNAIDADKSQDEEIKRPRIELNEAGKNRNRRLFGALLGTLNKFKDDTEKTSHVDKNRREINEKLHEKLELERKELAEKLRARKEEKERLAALNLQEEERIQKEKNEWQDLKEKEVLANFIKTRTEPVLYYLPEKLTDEMDLLIKKQKEDASEAREEFEKRNNHITNEDTAITDNEEEKE